MTTDESWNILLSTEFVNFFLAFPNYNSVAVLCNVYLWVSYLLWTDCCKSIPQLSYGFETIQLRQKTEVLFLGHGFENMKQQNCLRGIVLCCTLLGLFAGLQLCLFNSLFSCGCLHVYKIRKLVNLCYECLKSKCWRKCLEINETK